MAVFNEDILLLLQDDAYADCVIEDEGEELPYTVPNCLTPPNSRTPPRRIMRKILPTSDCPFVMTEKQSKLHQQQPKETNLIPTELFLSTQQQLVPEKSASSMISRLIKSQRSPISNTKLLIQRRNMRRKERRVQYSATSIDDEIDANSGRALSRTASPPIDTCIIW